MAYKLSFLIPARNEEFLVRTVQDLLENTTEDSEILVGLDGYWPNPGIPQHPRVSVIYVPESVGQRSLTKMLGRLSKAKYLAKIDAHCSVKKDFDKSMIKAMEKAGDDTTMTATMRNLWVFDWVCKCGHRHYQDKGEVCPQCKEIMTKDICWIAKPRPESNSFCFDATPHFQYNNEYTRRPEYLKQKENKITETMSLQGSFFMMTREKYFSLDIDDEAFGSWGSQGIEVACKTWLSGGKVLVNHRTWYAHCFRTKEAQGFGFPYPMSGASQQKAKERARDLFFNNKWKGQKKPLHWLVEKFYPVKGWTDEDLEKLKNVV